MEKSELFEPYPDGAGIEWLEETFIPQSMIFYAQLMPVIYRCAKLARRSGPLRIADIGAAHASGSNFIHNVLNNILGAPAEVTAFEMQPRYKRYAEAKFPAVRFKTIDFFDDPERYDIVVSSHTLEHIEGPREFVAKVMERVSCAIFYVPYRERNLIPGHVTSFDDALIQSMPGFVWGHAFRSVVWRPKAAARVAAFVCARPDAWSRLRVSRLTRSLDTEFVGAPIRRRSISAGRPDLTPQVLMQYIRAMLRGRVSAAVRATREASKSIPLR